MQCPAQLKRLYSEKRVIPFIGAGASMAVEWESEGVKCRGLSWSEVVDKAARLIGADDPELLRMRGTDLQILEYLDLKRSTMQPLISWLQLNMRPKDDDLRKSVVHQALCELDGCDVFYTTNYDDFIERALKLNGRVVTSIAAEHDFSQSLRGTQVIKFHGDFNRPDEMVMTESHYERRMRLEAVMDLKLQADVLGRALLFIGYSFRDPNVAYLFRLVTERFNALPKSFTGKRAYIIYPNPSDFELQLFNARNIEVIPVYGANPVNAIADLLADMVE